MNNYKRRKGIRRTSVAENSGYTDISNNLPPKYVGQYVLLQGRYDYLVLFGKQNEIIYTGVRPLQSREDSLLVSHLIEVFIPFHHDNLLTSSLAEAEALKRDEDLGDVGVF